MTVLQGWPPVSKGHQRIDPCGSRQDHGQYSWGQTTAYCRDHHNQRQASAPVRGHAILIPTFAVAHKGTPPSLSQPLLQGHVQWDVSIVTFVTWACCDCSVEFKSKQSVVNYKSSRKVAPDATTIAFHWIIGCHYY
jgi:hypothetical protein